VSLLLVALLWLWLVRVGIPDIPTEGEPGPRAFPLLLGILLAVLGIAMTAWPSRELAARVTRRETAVAAGTFALLVLYAFLLERAGFIASTVLVMALAMAGVMGMRRWMLVGSLSLGFTAGCWLIFDGLLGTPLPRGSWVAWL
jgi:hypothetical protein